MSGLESLAQSFAFNAPELASGTGRIAQMISARRTANKTAGRIEGAAGEEARLRAIQGARLLGAQRASFAGRGVEGGSAATIAGETAGFEALDAGRIISNAQITANEVRKNGLASALAASLGLVRTAEIRREADEQNDNLGREADEQNDNLAGLKGTTLPKRKTLLSADPIVTVLPATLDGRGVFPGELA
jgi:hypothetical protein